MVPERVIFVGSLHTNRAGKLDRKSMATQLISESPKPTHEVAERYDLRSATETVLAHIYRQLLEQDRIDLKSDFMTLGGDSFQATSLIMMVETTLRRALDAAPVPGAQQRRLDGGSTRLGDKGCGNTSYRDRSRGRSRLPPLCWPFSSRLCLVCRRICQALPAQPDSVHLGVAETCRRRKTCTKP